MDTQVMINKMIDDILDGNSSDAQDTFSSIMSQKVTDALDTKKVEISQTLYSQEEPDNELEQADS